MKKQLNQSRPGLGLRTHLNAGYTDQINHCMRITETRDLWLSGQTSIRATCLDLNNKWKHTSLRFPNSYKGVVANCDGKLTQGACG